MIASPTVPRLSLPPTRRLRVVRYENLQQVRSVLKALERAGAHDIVVTLILDEWFAGHLPALVRRRRLGRALVVTAAPGHSGRVNLAGWPASPAELGWRCTLLEPDAERALRRAADLSRDGDAVIVLAPAGSTKICEAIPAARGRPAR